jgi:hypothetical protein
MNCRMSAAFLLAPLAQYLVPALLMKKPWPSLFIQFLLIYVPVCPPTAEALLFRIVQLQNRIHHTNTFAR